MVFSKQFWTVLVRPSVLPFFILALIDCGLTVYGTSRALGGPLATSMVVGLIVGTGVLITLLSTFDIWGSWHPVLRESPIMTRLLRGLWVVVFLYDWFTSMVGIYDLTGLSTEQLGLFESLTQARQPQLGMDDAVSCRDGRRSRRLRLDPRRFLHGLQRTPRGCQPEVAPCAAFSAATSASSSRMRAWNCVTVRATSSA